MARIKGHCSNCCQTVKISVGQKLDDLHLRWYFSYVCPFCNGAVEGDDTGIPPEYVRKALLEERGEWILLLDDSESKKLAAIKILRQALNLSLAEALSLSKRLPSYLARGTEVEMEWLKSLLKAENVRSVVKKWSTDLRFNTDRSLRN